MLTQMPVYHCPFIWFQLMPSTVSQEFVDFVLEVLPEGFGAQPSVVANKTKRHAVSLPGLQRAVKWGPLIIVNVTIYLASEHQVKLVRPVDLKYITNTTRDSTFW